MEDVLEVYRRPHDPRLPMICLDVRVTKAGLDLAHEIQELLDVGYPQAGEAVLVWDNLNNTHAPASLY